MPKPGREFLRRVAVRRRVDQQWKALEACCGLVHHPDRDMFEIIREKCELSKRKMRKLNDGGQAQFELIVEQMKEVIAAMESAHSAYLADGLRDALA
jgi:hypothetical protein